MLIAQNSVEQKDLGVASSASTFFRSIGGSFGVSLFGLAATTVYQYLITSMPEDMMTAGMIIISIAIWTVAIGLFVYAMNMRKAGVLR
jgi:hypothetical protein